MVSFINLSCTVNLGLSVKASSLILLSNKVVGIQHYSPLIKQREHLLFTHQNWFRGSFLNLIYIYN